MEVSSLLSQEKLILMTFVFTIHIKWKEEEKIDGTIKLDSKLNLKVNYIITKAVTCYMQVSLSISCADQQFITVKRDMDLIELQKYKKRKL